MTVKLGALQTRSSICIFVSLYPEKLNFNIIIIIRPFHLALRLLCRTSCKFFKSDKKQMNGLILIRLAIIQLGRVQKSCLNRWLSLWLGVYLLRLSHLAISWKPPSWKDQHTDTGAWSNSWNSPLCLPRFVHLLQSHRTNIKLLLQKSREDQDTRMRGRTVIHVPYGRTIINDYKFRTQVLNWWVHKGRYTQILWF